MILWRFLWCCFLFLASLGGVVFDQNRMCQETAVNTNSLLIYFGKILFSGLHWRLQNIFVEDSDIDTSWFCGVFSGVVFVSGLPRGRCFWSKQDVSRNRCEHEFAFNFDLSIQLPSMPFPVHQWMQGWFRLALKASSAAHVHGLAPAWKVKLGRNAKLGREVWT